MRDDLIRRAFGRRLRRFRKLNGLTQENLARQTTLKRTSITNIEKGRQSISLPALYSLANILDVEVHDLLPSRKDLEELLLTEEKIPRLDNNEQANIQHWLDTVMDDSSS